MQNNKPEYQNNDYWRRNHMNIMEIGDSNENEERGTL